MGRQDRLEVVMEVPLEVLDLAGTGHVCEFKNGAETYRVGMGSVRYRTFKNSLACAACGIKGTRLFLERFPHSSQPHLNLYAEENGDLMLMTKDHINPKARGGGNSIVNLQTMCHLCNAIKGDSDMSPEEVAEIRNALTTNMGAFAGLWLCRQDSDTGIRRIKFFCGQNRQQATQKAVSFMGQFDVEYYADEVSKSKAQGRMDLWPKFILLPLQMEKILPRHKKTEQTAKSA